MSHTSFADDQKVSDICKITYEAEELKWMRDFQDMREIMQRNINKALEDMSSRQLDALDRNLAERASQNNHGHEAEKTQSEGPASPMKPSRLSMQENGSVAIEQLISALKTFDDNMNSKQELHKSQVTDYEEDEEQEALRHVSIQDHEDRHQAKIK